MVFPSNQMAYSHVHQETSAENGQEEYQTAGIAVRRALNNDLMERLIDSTCSLRMENDF